MPVKEKTTGKKGTRFRGRLPAKRSINLALVGIKRMNWALAALGIVLICIGAAAFGKFLVYDRLERVTTARAEANFMKQQLSAAYETLNGFEDISELYPHYTYSGMTDAEKARVDRVEIMDLLERVVMPRTDVDAWTLTENQLTLDITGESLQEINLTVQALLREPLVAFSTVKNARTDQVRVRDRSTGEESEEELVTANIVIDLATPAPEGEPDAEEATAG